MSDIIYEPNIYSDVIKSKNLAETYINQVYANFENLTFDKKMQATIEIDALRVIIFEYDKYIINYQERNKNTKSRSSYIVMEGDTLPYIASKIYNDSKKWVDIYNYNNLTDTILEVGSVINIPEV